MYSTYYIQQQQQEQMCTSGKANRMTNGICSITAMVGLERQQYGENITLGKEVTSAVYTVQGLS